MIQKKHHSRPCRELNWWERLGKTFCFVKRAQPMTLLDRLCFGVCAPPRNNILPISMEMGAKNPQIQKRKLPFLPKNRPSFSCFLNIKECPTTSLWTKVYSEKFFLEEAGVWLILKGSSSRWLSFNNFVKTYLHLTDPSLRTPSCWTPVFLSDFWLLKPTCQTPARRTLACRTPSSSTPAC